MKIVIFAGGVGTRLWPLSRKNSPKQFGKMIGDKSTLQQTISRLLPEFPAEDIYIATGKRYESIVREQLPFIPAENFIFEPTMRDVGPAIGLSAYLLAKKFPDEPVAILWSDHMVKHEETFRKMLLLAEKQISSQKAKFLFIAQKPRFANQNLGWIALGKKAEDIEGEHHEALYNFHRLIYRPKLTEAHEFFEDKKYVWNLGYFVTTPRFLTSLFEQYAPEISEGLNKIQDAYQTEDFAKVLDEVYPTLEKISFDDAILVKLPPQGLQVISVDLGWSDVGAWDALKEALTDSIEENITHGNVMIENSTDSLVFNYSEKLCIGIDLAETLVIETDDVLLVCPKTSVPKIKKFVERLNGTEYEHLV
ncbi:MAG: sugar phosphate nucleotidyltransferase [Patescibacteria group bacterium]